MFNNIMKSLGRISPAPAAHTGTSNKRIVVTPLENTVTQRICIRCSTAATLKVEEVNGKHVRASAYYCKRCFYTRAAQIEERQNEEIMDATE
jgi:hypothetical protein